jgi:hypothetical protein
VTKFRESLLEHRDGTQGVDLNGNNDTQDDVWMNTIFLMINNPHDATDRFLEEQFWAI